MKLLFTTLLSLVMITVLVEVTARHGRNAGWGAAVVMVLIIGLTTAAMRFDE